MRVSIPFNASVWANDNSGCAGTRGSRRVVIRDSYAYAPRERYIERRHYHHHRDWDDGPRVGIRAPGVSVGVGVDSHRW